jgi:glycosyltransferase involved in cell wall biosynthesis
MVCGVSCVVTDVGDSRLVVGGTGIVVPPDDPEALARGLGIMANRIVLEPELGKTARARIVSSFSLPMLVAKTSEALLALA